MPSFGFVGPSYESKSLTADAQKCLNFFLEPVESGQGKSRAILLSTPGTRVFAALPEKPTRGTYYGNDRAFVVAGASLYELLADKTYKSLGAVLSDGKPASIAANPNELMVASSGVLYRYDLKLETFSTLADPANVAQVGYTDSYFIALLADGSFRISGLLNGATWDPADVAKVSLFPDGVVSMLIDHREIWLWGDKHTAVYGDSGNPDFPFEPISGGFLEQGIGAPASAARIDNSAFWLHADERGAGMAYRAQGYSPARVSNYAIEQAWQSYATIADAVGYAYQEDGHSFWVLYFPTANKTWVLDVGTGMWHERDHIADDGSHEAHRSWCHMYAFGKHLLGDWRSGNVLQASTSFYDDAGTEIERVRRAPHIANENAWIFHSELYIDLETGLGPIPPVLDSEGHPRGPQACLRFSNNGAKTWTNENWVSVGQAGEYEARCVWRRLGRARDRVYELKVSDPIPWRIIDAYVKVTKG